MKGFFEKFKWWAVTLAAIVASSATFGYTIDRPAWISEVRGVRMEVEDIAERVAANERSYLQMQIDQVQRQVWAVQDRMQQRPTQSDRERLRELQQQLNRLKQRLARIRG